MRRRGRRASIILLAAGGTSPERIAKQVGCSLQTVRTWISRWRSADRPGYSAEDLVRDATRTGRPGKYLFMDDVWNLAHGPPPPGKKRYTARLIAEQIRPDDPGSIYQIVRKMLTLSNKEPPG